STFRWERLGLRLEKRIDNEELRRNLGSRTRPFCWIAKDRRSHKHRQRQIIHVIEVSSVSAAKRDCSVLEEESQTDVQINWFESACSRDIGQVRRTLPNIVSVSYLGKKLYVRCHRYRGARVQQQLVWKIEYLDVIVARVCCMDVADVLIQPESLSATLLTEHHDRSVLIFTARATPRARAEFI